MGSRDERLRDLFFETPTTPGAPTEEGQVRLYNNDIQAYIDGEIKSLTAGAGSAPLLGRSIFKTDGGMVYSTNGDVLIKVTA